MNGVMTIDAFHSQIMSTSEDSLVEALRKFLAAEKEEVQAMMAETIMASWSGWYL